MTALLSSKVPNDGCSLLGVALGRGASAAFFIGCRIAGGRLLSLQVVALGGTPFNLARDADGRAGGLSWRFGGDEGVGNFRFPAIRRALVKLRDFHRHMSSEDL